MKTLFVLLVLALFFSFKLLSCSNILPDDKLSLLRKDNLSNKLKLNGYYFQKGSDNNIYSVNIFYKNGINLYAGGNYSFQEFEKLLIETKWSEDIRKNKTWWGLYEINGDEIKFERYYSSSGGPLPAYIRSGKILNDTTFIITKSMRSDGSEVSTENETYHFRQFSPKPDSTNNFIK